MAKSTRELERRVSALERKEIFDQAQEMANQWRDREKKMSYGLYQIDPFQKVRDELAKQIDELNKEKAQLEFDKALAAADDKVEYLASIIREKLVHL